MWMFLNYSNQKTCIFYPLYWRQGLINLINDKTRILTFCIDIDIFNPWWTKKNSIKRNPYYFTNFFIRFNIFWGVNK